MAKRTRDPPSTVWEIPRNDIEACRAYWFTGRVTPNDLHVMLLLQDDPSDLIAAMKRWGDPPGRSR